MLTRFIMVGAAVGAALVIAIAVSVGAQGEAGGEIWVVALFAGVPVGVLTGGVLGLVAGLVRSFGGPRWLAATAATAAYASATMLLGATARWVLTSTCVIGALSWIGAHLADRWSRRLA